MPCEGKNEVLCEENDDGNNKVTSNSSTVLNSSESTKISQRPDDIDIDILKLFEGNFTLNMTIQWVAGLFTKIQDVMDDILLDVSETLSTEIQTRLRKIIMTVTDNVANFTLSKMTTGGAAVVFKTPFLELHLEKNTIQTLTNCTSIVGPHTGFRIPSAEHIFPHLSRNVTLNRVIFRLGYEWHQILNTSDQFTTDILSLWFSSEDGQVIKGGFRIKICPYRHYLQH
ncbi:uncharacterized protein [Ptychodera flava]|uniref:uncharacterized protein n=1 Tax=Ptychodera flava TaxID=63121 RepID=UPI003969FC40